MVIQLNAQPSSALQEFLFSDILEHCQVSIYAESMNEDKVLDAHFEKSALIPASNVKLVTTALAWDLLGPDFNFETSILIKGRVTEAGVLEGDLLIEGGGDPSLGSEKWPERKLESLFNQLILSLQKNKIREIQGDVVLFTSPWKGEWHHRDWAWADIGNYYGISSGAINTFENKYELTFSTSGEVGEEARILKTEPFVDLQFKNEVKIGPPHSGDQAYIFGNAQDSFRLIRGSVPKQRSTYSIKGALPDPEVFFTRRLFEYLKEEEIEVSGDWRVERNSLPKGGEVILVYSSPPLSQIVQYVNSSSHNLFAEAIHKYLSLKRPFLMDSKMKELKASGVDFDRIRWKDGCGLSPFNRFSAKDLVHILKWMKNEKAFLNTLAQPGKEGTLEYRFKNLMALKAKTGSIEGVYALSGILGEDEIAFSIIINNFYGPSRLMDQKVEQMLRSWLEN